MKKELFLIAGPCVVESAELLDTVASHLVKVTGEIKIPLVFKASYKKANRSKLGSFTGVEKEKALKLLAGIREKFGLKVITDVHESYECAEVAEYVDYLQIPAFLCRQTDLLIAAGKTGKGVNIKKGQFLSPEAMKFAIEKVESTGNKNIWVTERGTTFGYNDLIVDMTSIPRMQAFGATVIMDCTHSVQKPNLGSGITGGNRQMIETLALAAVAAGTDGLFLEVHPDPPNAMSDADSQLPLEEIGPVLKKCIAVRNALNESKKD